MRLLVWRVAHHHNTRVLEMVALVRVVLGLGWARVLALGSARGSALGSVWGRHGELDRVHLCNLAVLICNSRHLRDSIDYTHIPNNNLHCCQLEGIPQMRLQAKLPR